MSKICGIVFCAVFLLYGSSYGGPINTGPFGITELNATRANKDSAENEVLDFLKKLKVALDDQLLGDPEKFQNIAGIETIEWNKNDFYQTKVARRWRFFVDKLNNKSSQETFVEIGYGLKYGDDKIESFGFSISNLHHFSCIRNKEINQIFGVSFVKFQMRAMPLHDVPRWEKASNLDGYAYIYDEKASVLLSFFYEVEDSPKPHAKCLVSVSVSRDEKNVPQWYLNTPDKLN